MAKEAINSGIELDMESGMAVEGAKYAAVLNSRDRLEGLKAFAEKRSPLFVGE